MHPTCRAQPASGRTEALLVQHLHLVQSVERGGGVANWHDGLARRACSCRFNFRATKYLWEEGWTKFFHWYDHMSWYPLGRPVGTTIYPGMQITSVRARGFQTQTRPCSVWQP